MFSEGGICCEGAQRPTLAFCDSGHSKFQIVLYKLLSDLRHLSIVGRQNHNVSLLHLCFVHQHFNDPYLQNRQVSS